MNKFTHSQKGLTLIELLVALAISTIVIALIYSVLTTGIKLYYKIETESQLRDDADYIATKILNEMYTNAPKSVKLYSDGSKQGIEFIRAGEKKIDGYLVEDNPSEDIKIQIYFEDYALYIKRENEDSPEKIETYSAVISEGSSLTLGQIGTCTIDKTECTSGSIELTLVLESKNINEGLLSKREPLVLNSSFGF